MDTFMDPGMLRVMVFGITGAQFEARLTRFEARLTASGLRRAATRERAAATDYRLFGWPGTGLGDSSEDLARHCDARADEYDKMATALENGPAQ